MLHTQIFIYARGAFLRMRFQQSMRQKYIWTGAHACLWLLITTLVNTGCVGLKIHNPTRAEYLRSLPGESGGRDASLAIIEFDDQGSSGASTSSTTPWR